MQVECGCYLALHPELARQPKFKGLQNLIPQENRAGWQMRYKNIKEPERFHYWNEQFAEILADKIVEPFHSFLRIALMQQNILSLSPVEWARTLTDNLIYALNWTVPHLIKNMCDEQENRLDINVEKFDAYCCWVYWRAPRLIHMEPSGNTIYDPETVWQRESVELTSSLLRGLSSRMLDPAQFKLGKLAGEAYVALASTTPLPKATNDKEPSTTKPPKAATPDCAMGDLNLQIKPKLKLPPKKMDLSQYLDQARLTERQRDCISLKMEYGLTTSDIAGRLSISRKTVDEHVEAAKRNMDAARSKAKSNAKKARFNPEG
jgi:DNA-binding CsgD family transcriptional regulator